MKTVASLLVLLLSGCDSRAERVIFTGLDLSATAWHGGNNFYESGWVRVLSTVEGGDHVYATIINGKGLANGAPVIDFTIRSYNRFTDRRKEYDTAVQAKL